MNGEMEAVHDEWDIGKKSPDLPPTPYGIYLRVSSKDQVTNDQQEARIRQRLEDTHRYCKPEWVRAEKKRASIRSGEKIYSAEKYLERRPVLKSFYDDKVAGRAPIKELWLYHSDRWARADLGETLLRMFADAGIRVLFLLSTNDPSARKYTMQGDILYSETQRRNTNEKHLYLIEQGRPLCRPPYGFRAPPRKIAGKKGIKTEAGGEFYRQKKIEIEKVVQAFQMAARGAKPPEISKETGLPRKKIWKILRNHFYAGIGRYTRKEYGVEKITYYRLKGDYPLTLEFFNQVQQVLGLPEIQLGTIEKSAEGASTAP